MRVGVICQSDNGDGEVTGDGNKCLWWKTS